MPRILVVEDDAFTLETYGLVLRVAGYDVGLAATREQGLNALRVGAYDLVLADLALPDGDAIQLLSEMERGNLRASVIVVTGFGTIDTAVEAMRLGAVDYVEKPLVGDDLLAKVQHALERRERAVPGAAPPIFTHPTERWARVVLRLRESDRDVPRVASWAGLVGVSTSTLRDWCRLANVTAGHSLDLGRFVRAVRCARGRAWEAAEHFEVSDPRTLRRLLSRAGLSARAPSVVLDDLLASQTFVTDARALAALHSAIEFHPGA